MSSLHQQQPYVYSIPYSDVLPQQQQQHPLPPQQQQPQQQQQQQQQHYPQQQYYQYHQYHQQQQQPQSQQQTVWKPQLSPSANPVYIKSDSSNHLNSSVTGYSSHDAYRYDSNPSTSPSSSNANSNTPNSSGHIISTPTSSQYSMQYPGFIDPSTAIGIPGQQQLPWSPESSSSSTPAPPNIQQNLLPRLPSQHYTSNPAQHYIAASAPLTSMAPPSHPPNITTTNTAVLPVSAISSAFALPSSSLPSRSSISSNSSSSTATSPISPIHHHHAHLPAQMLHSVPGGMYPMNGDLLPPISGAGIATTMTPGAVTQQTLRMLPDIGTSHSLFQMFENTPLNEPHLLYCKKCALFKPAVEFASTTGFFNNNCKHCRNYRRKGEDAKSEAVQELYRVASYDQLKSTLYEVIRTRRIKGSSLVCVHFYLDPSFIGNCSINSALSNNDSDPTNDRIDSPRYQTAEGRSILANTIVREIKAIDMYSYNHRSTRVFKSGETHKYLCSQSTALPWRQKKRNAALAAAQASVSEDGTPMGVTPEEQQAAIQQLQEKDPDLHNCSGTILVKFKSPGQANQRVCVAYCHDVSHAPKLSKGK